MWAVVVVCAGATQHQLLVLLPCETSVRFVKSIVAAVIALAPLGCTAGTH